MSDEPSTPDLISCAKNSDIQGLEALLKNGADPNFTPDDEEENTALHWAIIHKNFDMVKLLLDHGADITIRNGRCCSCYHVALKSFFEERNRKNKIKRQKIIQLLLEHGKQNRQISASYRTFFAVSQAIFNNDQEAVLAITKRSGQISFGEVQEFYDPPILATKLNRQAITKLMLDNTKDLGTHLVDLLRYGDYKCMKTSVDYGLTGRHTDCFKRTALHLACSFANLRSVQLLLTRTNSSPEAQDRGGDTPLMFAVGTPGTLGGEKVMRYILKKFKVLDINIANKEGMTLLHHVVDRCEEYSFILEHGADPKSSPKSDFLPALHECELDCAANRTLKKLDLIDPEFFEREKQDMSPVASDTVLEYQKELEALKRVVLCRGKSTPNQSLFHFLFFTPNKTARYAKNVHLVKIYKNNRQDFGRIYPHYGFVLNYQFRRGMARRNLIDLAIIRLHKMVGIWLPFDIVDMIFQHFTDKNIKKFLK